MLPEKTRIENNPSKMHAKAKIGAENLEKLEKCVGRLGQSEEDSTRQIRF